MKRKVPKDHTTPMLVAVLSIFLITELPQGVMNVLTGIFTGDTFHQKVSKSVFFLRKSLFSYFLHLKLSIK